MSVEEKSGPNGSPGAGAGLDRVREELRAPIERIVARCEALMAPGGAPESFQADLDRMRASGRNLISLIESTLDETGLENRRTEADWRQIIHDMRTPINHLVGFAEMLSEDADDDGCEPLKAELDQIREAARAWLSVMNSRLAWLRQKSAGASPNSDGSLIHLIKEDCRSKSISTDARPAETGRILVIDDDELNRDLLARRLTQQGHTVETAPDGETGLKRLQEGDFELVLLDMLMPGLTGVEVLAKMKADQQLRKIPVIVISALDDEAGIAQCIELGAEDYLSKPFYPAVLRARIGTSLEKRRLRAAEKQHLATIEEGRRRSDRLLLNILPNPIAERLKSGEQGIADHFSEVTVMFADLVSFTALSAESPPAKVVGMLNQIFSAFDRRADQHGLEKIKTIGDAYMAVGGLPDPREDHAEAVAALALNLMADLESLNREFDSEILLRIGIDTGPVIAGIIGINKFIYDLWGDTVNTASRMESHGVPGRIQVSERTWRRLDGNFALTPRGEIEVKGKGTMKTWFLEKARLPSP